jgi:dihydroorotate dehydrogenase (fumarate)
MDLSTRYMGLSLPHPFVAGASPLCQDLSMARRLEDAGAAALVMHSLFEEQIRREQLEAFAPRMRGESRFDAVRYAPEADRFPLGPEEYLAHLAQLKAAVDIPVFGSLNGVTLGGWLEYARGMEQAGADGLELNVYGLPADVGLSGQSIEDRTIEMVRAVRASVRIPLAVKLMPYYTAPLHFMRRLAEGGADALVLFNRFYQPDRELGGKESERHATLSDGSELPLRLHWLSLASGQVAASLAASGGIASALDAAKAVMCGADAVQIVSALVRNGPEHLATLRKDLGSWMERQGHASLEQIKGCMDFAGCPDPEGYERAHYMFALQRAIPRR